VNVDLFQLCRKLRLIGENQRNGKERNGGDSRIARVLASVVETAKSR